VPIRMIMFAAVGATDVIVHLAILRLALILPTFPLAQALASAAAITSNFILNNILTYRIDGYGGFDF
jgi:dolichol-phosphate mannosyltransferase